MIHYFQETSFGIELSVLSASSLCYPIHNHVSVFTAGIVIEGAMELTMNKEVRCRRKNDMFLIPPYVPHKITAIGEYTLISCCIKKSLPAAVPMQALQNTTAALLEEAKAYCPFTDAQSAMLTDFLQFCTEASAEKDFSRPYLSELIRQMERSPENDFFIDTMADSCYISKYHLIRRMKEEIGLTPHQFLIQNRVRKAQRLLHEDVTVTEAALAAGFFDQSHFIRYFKRLVGLTPAAYRSVYVPVDFAAGNVFHAGMNFANR